MKTNTIFDDKSLFISLTSTFLISSIINTLNVIVVTEILNGSLEIIAQILIIVIIESLLAILVIYIIRELLSFYRKQLNTILFNDWLMNFSYSLINDIFPKIIEYSSLTIDFTTPSIKLTEIEHFIVHCNLIIKDYDERLSVRGNEKALNLDLIKYYFPKINDYLDNQRKRITEIT